MKYIILILFLPIICFSQNAYHFEYDVRLNSLERKAHLNISKESTSFYYEVSEKSSSKNKKSENKKELESFLLNLKKPHLNKCDKGQYINNYLNVSKYV